MCIFFIHQLYSILIINKKYLKFPTLFNLVCFKFQFNFPFFLDFKLYFPLSSFIFPAFIFHSSSFIFHFSFIFSQTPVVAHQELDNQTYLKVTQTAALGVVCFRWLSIEKGLKREVGAIYIIYAFPKSKYPGQFDAVMVI